MLYNGEQVGDGHGPECDVAVDPIDGTTLMAKGMPNAIAVMAVADRGAMYDPSAVFYMEKIATGPAAADVVDITAPVAENIRRVAKAKKRSAGDVTVCILDRPRHEQLVQEVREAGARIKFITDGDVAGAIAAAREGTGVDLLLGIGGTPEGIIAACALKCMGGALQGKLWPKDDDERQKALDAGHDLDRVLHIDDLVRGDVFFVATGITDGELLRGVQYRAGGCTTQSLVMRSRSGTIRSIESLHSLEKLRAYSAVPFDRDGRTEPERRERRAGGRRRRHGGSASRSISAAPAAGRLTRRQAAQPEVAEHRPAVDDDRAACPAAGAPRASSTLPVAEHGPAADLGVDALADDHLDVAEHRAELSSTGRRRCAGRAGRSARRRRRWSTRRGAECRRQLDVAEDAADLLRCARADDLATAASVRTAGRRAARPARPWSPRRRRHRPADRTRRGRSAPRRALSAPATVASRSASQARTAGGRSAGILPWRP